MEIPVGYAQVNLLFTGLSVPTGAQCTFGVDVSGFTGTPLDAGNEILGAWLTAGVAVVQTDTTTLAGVLVKFGPVETGPSATAPGSITGGISSTGASPAVAALVKKETAFGGRAGRGRMYLPGMGEANVETTGTLNTTYRAAVEENLEDFRAICDSVSLPWVLLHGEGSPFAPYPITGLSVDPVVATQRRRQRR